MTGKAVRIVGSPTLFAAVPHRQDREPLLEIAFTTDGLFPTAIVFNIRTDTWRQTPLDVAATEAVMVLAGGARADNTETLDGVAHALRHLPPEALDRLFLLVKEIEMMCRSFHPYRERTAGAGGAKCSSGKPIADHYPLRCSHECDGAAGAGEAKTFAEATLIDIDVVFDGPPSHESGRFVECESPAGVGISAGEWIDRGDGYWALRIRGAR